MTSPGRPIRAIDSMGRAKVRLTAPQTLTDFAFTTTQVEFDHAEYDDLGYWDQQNFEFRIPPGMAGVYEITASAAFETDSTGTRELLIRSNIQQLGISSYEATSSDEWRMTASALVALPAGFTVSAEARQDSGGDLDLVGDDPESGSLVDSTFLAIARVQPLEESQIA